MGVAHVEGANGGIHTHYTGKKDEAVEAFCEQNYDFAYIHIEAPDEMGHQGSAERKIKAIENIDEFVVGPLARELQERGEEFRMLILPDHPTPIHLRTHTADEVLFLLYDTTTEVQNTLKFTEKDAKAGETHFANGFELIEDRKSVVEG